MKNLSEKQEEKICKEWLPKKLGNVAEFKNGLNYVEGDCGYEIKMIGVQDFRDNFTISYASLSLVSLSSPPREVDLLRNGDLLFVRSNGNRKLIGRVLLIKDLREPISHSGFTIRARITDTELLPEFVGIYLRSFPTRKQIYVLGGGTNISNLSQDILCELDVPVPSLQEQKKLCEVLGCCGRNIERIEQLIDAKTEFKRGLMQQLLTGRTRFDEFVIDRGSHLTQYGPVPNDWEYLHIGDLAREVTRKNSDGRELTVLSCTKHHGLVDSLKYFGKRVFSENLSAYKVVKRGQFAYATNHIEEGSIGYQDLYDDALISPMYTVFETNEKVDHSFFFKLLKTELYRHIFEVNTSGSIDRRGGLRWSDFARIKVALPSRPEQRRIAVVLEVCDHELDLQREQLVEFKKQKQGLMQKLLTGQIRVKIDEAQAIGV